MNSAIGMLEFNSIALGIETADFMVKAAKVDLLRSSTVCPGKYIVIVGGEVSSVKSSMKTGLSRGEEGIIDTLLIPNIHEKVPPAISLTSNIKKFGAIGVVEFYSIASAIKAADAAAKAAEVSLIEIRMGLAVGGKGFVTMTGQVADVQTAVKAATLNAPLLVHSVVIPRPSKAVIESLF